jgi:hypothetical protein
MEQVIHKICRREFSKILKQMKELEIGLSDFLIFNIV